METRQTVAPEQLPQAPRSAVQRRAVLAERLLLDLGGAATRSQAAAMVTQAVTAIGGATGATVLLRDPALGADAPGIVLASTGTVEDDVVRVTDAASGLELHVAAPEVPVLALRRSVRALAAVCNRVTTQERLLAEARTDALTGLPNRRAFDERLASELARQRRAGGEVSVLLLDVDRFKAINDTHGHGFGDEVLCSVADAIRSVARRADVAARIGGDEFALLLPDTDQVGAHVLASRLCRAVRASGPDVTVSIGGVVVTSAGGAETSSERVLQVADEALYDAKASGRDRAVLRTGAAVTV